jgi:uncharacterized protein YlzI (FlbEa/FlbD family)
MLKLTRLNHQPVAINPDHISYIEAHPDTTLYLFNSERLLVRESVDEVIAQVIEFRRAVHLGASPVGDPPHVPFERHVPPSNRASSAPSYQTLKPVAEAKR